MLYCSLVCSFVPLFFLSHLFLVTLYHFQPHSLKDLFLFSSCMSTDSHVSHSYSFLNVLTPRVLLSLSCCTTFSCFISLWLSVTHVQFSLFYHWIPGGIFALLPSGNKGCYSSISLMVFMFLVQHQWWCDQKILTTASSPPHVHH